MIIVVGKSFATTPNNLVDRLEEHHPSRYVSYTGRRRIRAEQDDVIVNWGFDGEIRSTRPCKILNKTLTPSKMSQLDKMNDHGVPCPSAANTYGGGKAIGFPVLARRDGMHGGKGIRVCENDEDVDAARGWGVHFFSEYIPKIAEFRVHVFGGEAIGWTKKLPRDEDVSVEQVAWNFENGFVQENTRNRIQRLALSNIAIDACKAIGYDFGAVDIIMDKYGALYVLEVNSAPALQVEDRMSAYVDKIIQEADNA